MLLHLGRGLAPLKPSSDVLSPWYKAEGYKADGVSPSLFLDFVYDRYAAVSAERNFSDVLSFSRASTATYFDVNGVMQVAAANEPRFDYDPVSVEAKGILVEGQRTNYIRNSTNVGATTGVIGSGGALPTNWGSNARGLVTEITTNIDASGIPVIRIRMYGTPTSSGAAYITLDANNVITTVNGDAWSSYAYMRLVGGDWTNTINAKMALNVFSSGISWLQEACAYNLSGLTSLLSRVGASGTVTNASAAYVQPLVQMGVTAGQSVDVTFDIGGIQCEKGAFPSSYIPTSGSAVSRSADVLSSSAANIVNFSDWYNQSEGTLYFDWGVDALSFATTRLLYAVYKTSDQWNYRMFGEGANGPYLKHNAITAGSFVASIGGGSVLGGGTYQDSFAYKTNDFSSYRDGGSLGVDNTGTVPSGIDALTIGGINSSYQIFGYLKSLRYYSHRVSNTEQQRITQ